MKKINSNYQKTKQQILPSNKKINSKFQVYQQLQKNKQLHQQNQVSLFALFRYASKLDVLYMIIGTLGVIGASCVMPAFQILWAFALQQFISSQSAVQTLIKFIYFGAILFVSIACMMFFWGKAGYNQTIKVKQHYFYSLIRKRVGWYDINDQNKIISNFSRSLNVYKSAVSNKIGILLLIVISTLTKIGVAIYYGWYLGLMVLIGFPLIILSTFIFKKVEKKKIQVQLQEYAQADSRSSEAIINIETVKILNGQQYQFNKYKQLLNKAYKKTQFYDYLNGLGSGIMNFMTVSLYAWGIYYGSILIEQNIYNPNSITNQSVYTGGAVIAISNLIVSQVYQVYQLYPAIKCIGQGRSAAFKIYQVIDQQNQNQDINNQGIIPLNLEGKIRFQNVTFSYPKNKSKKILDSANFQLNQKSTAIIGQSGCGKSTIFQLIVRLYQPDQGTIYIDDIDIKKIDLKWLRQKIAYIIQEPPLITGTIKQNMLFGNPKASEQQIKQTLKIASAWDFINLYKEKIDTFIGQGGSLLSGGQKQRVAIALALIRKPKIILMDQATSALDKQNQKIIQKNILHLKNSPKIMFISHRQSVIQTAKCVLQVKNYKAQIQQLRSLKESFNYQKQLLKYPQIQKSNSFRKKQSKNKKNGGFVELIRLQTFKITKYQQNNPSIQKINSQKLQQEEKQEEQIAFFSRLFSYSIKYKIGFLLAMLSILLIIAMYPLFGLFIGKSIAILIYYPSNVNDFRSLINGQVLGLFLVSIGLFIGKVIQYGSFSFIGSNITKQIRADTYNKILKLPLQKFDIMNVTQKASSSILTYRLSADAQNLNVLTTSHIGILIQVILILIVGVVLSFVFQYRIAFIMLGFIPIVFLFSFIQMSFSDDKSQGVKQAEILSLAVNNIKMVYSYNRQQKFEKQYKEAIQSHSGESLKGIIVSSILFGLSQYSIFIVFGLLLFISIQIFTSSQDTSLQNVFTAVFTAWFAALAAGTQFYYLPDALKAQNSAKQILKLLDQQDQEQKQIRQGSKMIKQIKFQNLRLENIEFSYKSGKSDDKILNNFSLQINSGENIFIVGKSGCGKSTFWKLLLRLYDPDKGQIFINNIQIKNYDIHCLRSFFGVVNQEPVLFNDQFLNNIKYNLPQMQNEYVFNICKKVNAWKFILKDSIQQCQFNNDKKFSQSNIIKNKEDNSQRFSNNQNQLLKFFNRNLGPGGSHISGGQKQRIAIARTLIRNPQIIILDEATSALDKCNAQVIENAIKNSSNITTKISITHNLTSIENSNIVAVLNKGAVIEKGLSSDLKTQKGAFFNLLSGKRLSISI